MGEAKRRKQRLGSLYGTPQVSGHTRRHLDAKTKKRLQQLGTLAKGRHVEGDPFWAWMSVEVERIAGNLDDDALMSACQIISASMGVVGEEASLVEDCIWVNYGVEPSMPGGRLGRLTREIAHCRVDPNLYRSSGI